MFFFVAAEKMKSTDLLSKFAGFENGSRRKIIFCTNVFLCKIIEQIREFWGSRPERVGFGA